MQQATKFCSPKMASSMARARWISLSSNVIQKLPVSLSNSCSSRKRGHIIAHHLSWRRPSSMPMGFDASHSRIIGALTLSL